MRMSMGMSLSVRQEISLRQEISQMFGEQSGDIPVYSLHKISRLLGMRPIGVSGQLLVMLKRSLIVANQEYKVDSGNDWSCLTSNNLVSAIEALDKELKELTTGADAIPKDNARYAAVVAKVFDEERTRCVLAVKQWFENNYDDLLYKTDGKIPWPIVQRLRKGLSVWIASAINPFREDIEDMILSVAQDEGIRAQTAEDAWELMGGTIFTKK